jgi:hypothetical protein
VWGPEFVSCRVEPVVTLKCSSMTCAVDMICCKTCGLHDGDYEQDGKGGDTFLRNVGSHKIYTAPHPRRRHIVHGEADNILLSKEIG